MENIPKLNTKVPLDGYALAQEKHKDGTPHLHMLLSFKRKVNVTNCEFFNVLTGTHGNYQPTRDIPSALKYVMKYDQEPLLFGRYSKNSTFQALEQGSASKKRKTTDEVCEMVQGGSSFKDVMDHFPGFALLQKNKIDELVTYVAEHSTKDQMLPWAPMRYDGKNEETLALCAWINKNLFCKRAFKQAQLFIKSPSNFRKTSFVLLLEPYVRIYWAAHEDYFDGYSDELYDLICFDEFRAKDRPVTTLNTILDGGATRLRCRYKQSIKKENKPCIILSNYDIDQLYSKSDVAQSTFRNRLEVHSLEYIIDTGNIYFKNYDS